MAKASKQEPAILLNLTFEEANGLYELLKMNRQVTGDVYRVLARILGHTITDSGAVRVERLIQKANGKFYVTKNKDRYGPYRTLTEARAVRKEIERIKT